MAAPVLAFIDDPIEQVYSYAAGDDEEYDDEAAEEQSEEHHDRDSDPEQWHVD
jgi:hypothetical protein